MCPSLGLVNWRCGVGPDAASARLRLGRAFEHLPGLAAELPAEAVKYIRRIEELIGASVSVLSTSPERDDTILVQNPFEG